MRKIIIALIGLMFLVSWEAFAGQEEPVVSSGGAVWPQYYNGTNFRNPRIDPSTRATTTIEYGHHEIHGGSHYFKSNIATIASGVTTAYLLATPPGANQVHLTFSGTGSSITDVTLIEDIGGKILGTSSTIFNSDRNSSNTSGCTFYNTITGQYTGGTTIYRLKSGSANSQSRTPMVSNHNNEIILKSGVTYCFYFISGAADNLTNLQLEWYEHTPESN